MRCETALRRSGCALLFLAARLSAEDLTVISKVTVGDSVSASTQSITSSNSLVSSGHTDTLVHFPDGTMTMIDHKTQEYWQSSLEEMTAYWQKMARDMRGTPMEDLFGGREPPRLEKLPGRGKYAGYDCDRYSLSMGDALEVEFCSAPGLPTPPRYFEGRKLSSAAMGPMAPAFQKMYDELKKVNGFPVSTAIVVRTAMSRTQTLEEATEVKIGPIPASTFAVPPGYKKKKSPFAK